MFPVRVLEGLAFVVALLLGAAVQGQQRSAADWPHLRGPHYDAVSKETGLVEWWPERGPPILWTRELGQGYSGFVAVGGRVFTQFQSRSGQSVICLDADTGAEIWSQRVDWPWQAAGGYPGPYSTPTWSNDRVYYATPSGLVGCLDAGDGRALWSVDVRKKFNGRGTEFGYAATPLVEDGRVIVPVGGPGASLVALNADNGSTMWTAGDDAASYSPAYPITFRGRRLVVAFLCNSIVAHDPATGERLWRQELSTDYDEHSAWPLYAEPHLCIAAPFRVGARLLRLDETRAGIESKEVWASRSLSNDVCSSVLTNGHVYGFDLHQLQASAHRASRGLFKCLDFVTGAVRWETDRVGQATVLVADGKLILLNDTGTLILARANASTYEELARARVLDGGICWTPPTLSNGRLFVRNHVRAVCLFLGPPDTLDPNRTLAVPVAQSPSFDWGQLLSREPEFPHDAPTFTDLSRWFFWCIAGVFFPAGVVAGIVGLVAGWVSSTRPGLWAKAAFAAAAMLIGCAGTTLFSAWADIMVLTWPVSLYVAFRLTLIAITHAGRDTATRRSRLVARATVLLFLAICYGYYRLCLAVGYVVAWGFLGGFLPAAPFAILATRTRSRWIGLVADAMGFAVYFWFSGLLPGWKDRWGS
jgi:outer membrane protein assembly factor BamB